MQLSRFGLVITLTGTSLFGQTTINGGRVITGAWDASGATASKPAKSGSVLPVTCGVGEQFFNTSATAGQNLYLCSASNTWSQLVGGGGGSGASATASYVVTSLTGAPINARNLTAGDNVAIVDGGAGAPMTVNYNVHDTSIFSIRDDFPVAEPSNGFGELSWGIGGSGASWGFDTPVPNHPGIFRCGTSATAANFCRVFLGISDSLTLPRVDTNTNWKMIYVVRTDSASVASTTYYVGLGNGVQSSIPYYEIGVRFDNAGLATYNSACNAAGSDVKSTTNWMLITMTANQVYCRDTGVTLSPNTWYQIEISSTTLGTVQAVVNGSLPVSVSTAQTTTYSTTPMGFLAEVWTQSAAPRVLDLDFFSAKMTLGRRY